MPVSGVVGDHDGRDVGMKPLERCDCARRVRHRVARIDDDHVDAGPRDRLEKRRGAVQDLDVEPASREQEAGGAVEPPVARGHEHPQRSERANVPDVDRLFHGLRHGP